MKITARKYAQALVEILEEKKDPQVVIKNLLLVLRKRKQFRLLPKIIRAFEEQWLERRGIVKIEVTYPRKFPDSPKELENILSQKLGKTIDMNAIPSDSIIGGFRLLAADTLIDASVSGRLKALSRRLIA